jgi:hypothetical protein
MINIFQFVYQSLKQEVMTDHSIESRHIVLYLIAEQDKMTYYSKSTR